MRIGRCARGNKTFAKSTGLQHGYPPAAIKAINYRLRDDETLEKARIEGGVSR
ncbi:MAG: hypothetical protein K6T72_06695 [Anoxybacillus sp.]|nr:hypothetical protein [Anoxybacillus sp.]MCL6586189.1 hypothetical protein [Anoxybacillus sp.]